MPTEALTERERMLEEEVQRLLVEIDRLSNALDAVRAAAHERDWGRGRGTVIW